MAIYTSRVINVDWWERMMVFFCLDYYPVRVKQINVYLLVVAVELRGILFVAMVKLHCLPHLIALPLSKNRRDCAPLLMQKRMFLLCQSYENLKVF